MVESAIESENVLAHVELCGDLLLSGKLHDEVLVSRLALPNGCAQTKLQGCQYSFSKEVEYAQ